MTHRRHSALLIFLLGYLATASATAAASGVSAQATGVRNVAQQREVAQLLQHGHQLRSEMQWVEALRVYENTLNVAPDHSEALYWQAQALVGAGNFPAARDRLQRYLKAVPGSSRGWRFQAHICHALKDYAGGVYALDQAVRLDARVPPKTFLNRSYLQEKSGYSANRIFVGLEQGLLMFPRDTALLNRAIKLAQKHEAWERAEGYWRRVPQPARQQPEWLLLRASLSAAKGDSKTAEVYAKEGLTAWRTLPKNQQGSEDMQHIKRRIEQMLVAQE